MLNRRNAVKLGAAGLAGLTPAALIERAKGATDPIPDAVASRLRWHNPEIYDPAAFALDVVSVVGGHFNELMDYQAAAAYAAYKQALATLVGVTGLDNERYDHPIHKTDEAVLYLGGASFDSGVRLGAAIEQMRRTWMGPVGLCPHCQGKGGVGQRDGYDLDNDGPACEVCRGSGVLAR